MLTVSEVAERFGLTHKEAIRRLRRLEKTTGRRILSSRGSGKATRHFVDAKALSESLEGTPKPAVVESTVDFDAVAGEIADTVSKMDERHTRMSVELAETKKRVALLEEQVRGFIARNGRLVSS